MQKYYTVYKIDKENNDIANVAEFTKRKSVCDWLGIRLDNLAKYTTRDIENIVCKLKNDEYFVMIELEN